LISNEKRNGIHSLKILQLINDMLLDFLFVFEVYPKPLKKKLFVEGEKEIKVKV
jgi:hypothetical protein